MFSKIIKLFYIALEPLWFLCFRYLISQINWFRISTKSSDKNIPNIHEMFHTWQIQNLCTKENIPNFWKLVYTVIPVATLVVGVMNWRGMDFDAVPGEIYCVAYRMWNTLPCGKNSSLEMKAGFFMQLIEISAVLCNYWIEVLYRRHLY